MVNCLASILDDDEQKEAEDEDLGAGEQCDGAVIVREEGVAPTQAALRSQKNCDDYRHKDDAEAIIGGQGGQHGGER